MGATNNESSNTTGILKHLLTTWWAVGVALLGVLIVGGVALFLPNMIERMKFFIGAALSWLILVIVAIQAYIYRQQARIMGDSLVIGTRSYVGIHSIETEMTKRTWTLPRTLIIRIENIGKVPASDIRVSTTVSMFIPEPESVSENCRRFYSEVFNDDFGGVHLFPGNLTFEVRIPLSLTFSSCELFLTMEQKSIFTAHIKIAHNDGFNAPQQSETFFHYLARANRWTPRAIAPPQEIWEKEDATVR